MPQVENSTVTEAADASGASQELDIISRPDSVGRWIMRFAQGMLIGTGAILPGISGGVLSIIFGIYEPMIRFLSNIRKNFKKNLLFFLPVVLGMGAGVVALANLMEWLFAIAPAQTIMFFVGCILGTFPTLFAQAGKNGRRSGHTVALLLSAVISLALLFALDWFAGGGQTIIRFASVFGLELAAPAHTSTLLFSDVTVHPLFGGFGEGFSFAQWAGDSVLWIICGAIVAAGAIVPGMSPSSILIYLGLYEKMTAAFGKIDVYICIPLAIGMLLCLLLFSRFVTFLFNRAHGAMYNIVIGIVIASTVMIIPTSYGSLLGGIISIVTLAAGLVMALLLAKLQKKFDYRD